MFYFIRILGNALNGKSEILNAPLFIEIKIYYVVGDNFQCKSQTRTVLIYQATLFAITPNLKLFRNWNSGKSQI